MSTTGVEDPQPASLEQPEADRPGEPRYRSSMVKSKNPKKEPWPRGARVWVQLGSPPEWHQCEVTAARKNDHPIQKEREYQLKATDTKGLDIEGGKWFPQDRLWENIPQ